LVTDGLASKYPHRVHDFPPDETALVGAAWGYAQAGLTPILEIPYAKYLDCASDMFHEICATHWLTNGRENAGLYIRLQGFDKGTFGGNYHTHNSLHIPPGLDVVCYSNGLDYVRGVRYLLRQTAQAGRVCMSVDCTELLNRRHLYPERMDGLFLNAYPISDATDASLEMGFDDVVLYQPNTTSKAKCGAVAKNSVDLSKVKVVVVSYGNGLPTSLIAMNNMVEKNQFSPEEVLVVDSPYLSRPPQQLELLLQELRQHSPSAALVMADICKNGPAMPFASFVVKLQASGALPAQWRAIGAANTYNPLGQLLTFLSTEDIEQAVQAAVGVKK
jgi:deoxyxylulose-5-phosphate synthase